MQTTINKTLTALVALAVVSMSQSAWAQRTLPEPGSQDVRINTSGSALAARSPGSLVSAALGRATERNGTFLAGTEITETASDELSITNQLRVQSIQILFTNLNLLLNVYHNTLRAQFGLDPVLPIIPDFGTGSIPGLPDIPIPFGASSLDSLLDRL